MKGREWGGLGGGWCLLAVLAVNSAVWQGDGAGCANAAHIGRLAPTVVDHLEGLELDPCFWPANPCDLRASILGVDYFADTWLVV